MKIVVFAYHEIGCTGIEALLKNGFDIQAVFTHTDSPNENHFFRSVAKLCAEKDLPCYSPDDINHPLWIEQIRHLKPELIFSFYYRNMLGEPLLAIPRSGAFNLHGSLLPAYRGRAPVNWVLVKGEKETGVTLHKMVKKADAGEVVAQQKILIDEQDTALTLHHKINQTANLLLNQYLPLFKHKKITLTPQDEKNASYFGRRSARDGELDWQQETSTLHNLVRAVTQPYPGAFTFAGTRKLIIWQTKAISEKTHHLPGTIVSTDPLRIACKEGLLEIITGQPEAGLYMRGSQLATEMGLIAGMRFNRDLYQARAKQKTIKVLILGVNGFIGNHLTERLLKQDNYEVYGLDIGSNAVERFIGHPRFHLVEGDISIHTEWIEYHIKKCDVILPLVAIATPIEYTRNPLRVFELDFEENLKIVRYCVKYNKRIIFPSTSEVYGMCTDELFDEDHSNLVVGPIQKQRWIYSVSKQLLDRIIWAYGKKEGLRFTLFRPFNWMGPRLDSLDSARIGSSRAITQLILNLVDGTPIKLVDGGEQKRCFTDIDDGIEALFRIIENKEQRCDGQIINIGSPDNEASIRELAEMLLQQFEAHPLRQHFPPFAGMKVIESRAFYGDGYQDVSHRKPSISNAQRLLHWTPTISVKETVGKTLDFFLQDAVERDKQHA